MVLELLSEKAILNQVAAKYQLNPQMLSHWKSDFVKNASAVFERGKDEPASKPKRRHKRTVPLCLLVSAVLSEKKEGTMSNNMKRLIGYLVYVLAFGFIVFQVEELDRYYQEIFSHTFQLPYVWLFVSQFIFPIVVGLLLALPGFIRSWRQEGQWRADWIMLLAVGLPALGIATAAVCFLVPVPLMQRLYAPIIMLHPALIKTAGILLGFVLLSCWTKEPNR